LQLKPDLRQIADLKFSHRINKLEPNRLRKLGRLKNKRKNKLRLEPVPVIRPGSASREMLLEMVGNWVPEMEVAVNPVHRMALVWVVPIGKKIRFQAKLAEDVVDEVDGADLAADAVSLIKDTKEGTPP
jgi:hypothetical protein